MNVHVTNIKLAALDKWTVVDHLVASFEHTALDDLTDGSITGTWRRRW